jgi:hypothetical protein
LSSGVTGCGSLFDDDKSKLKENKDFFMTRDLTGILSNKDALKSVGRKI